MQCPKQPKENHPCIKLHRLVSSKLLNIRDILKTAPPLLGILSHSKGIFLDINYVFVQSTTSVCKRRPTRCWPRPWSNRTTDRLVVVFSCWRSKGPARFGNPRTFGESGIWAVASEIPFRKSEEGSHRALDVIYLLFPPFVVIIASRVIIPARKRVLLLINLVQYMMSLRRDSTFTRLRSMALIVHIYRMAHFVYKKLIVLSRMLVQIELNSCWRDTYPLEPTVT